MRIGWLTSACSRRRRVQTCGAAATEAWRQPGKGDSAVVDPVEVGFAAFFALLLVVTLRKHYGSEAGTRVLPIGASWLVATLVQMLPRIGWPNAEQVHRVTGITGILIMVVVAVVAIRQSGRLKERSSPDSTGGDLRA